MALVVRNCSDQKVTSLRRNVVVPRPFLLKDFLMDDMSSCSSNGFKSYPRRQCCTTVRFLMDVDLIKGRDRPKIRSKPVVVLAAPPPDRLKRSRSRAAASSATAALQRASVAVLNAVKLLPFPSVNSTTGRLSRKLLRRCFWKRNDRRCRLLGELLVEKDEPSDESNSNSTDTTAIATSSNSFDEVDFDTTQDDVVVGVTETSPSSVQNAEVWQNHEEKEQFSPVSVLDCPFKDEEEEEEESGSKFQLSLARVQEGGSKQKTRRFEGGMEPLNLEKRIALSEHRTSISTNARDGADVEGRETEEELEALLDQVKSATCHPSNGADNLLLDFFRESLVEDNVALLSEREALTLARDWVNGTTRELVVGWEVQEGREMYVKDMDKERCWRGTTSFEEKEEVALELESDVWESLVNELLVDLF